MPDVSSGVKIFYLIFYLIPAHTPCGSCPRAFEHLWMLLCKNGRKLISHSLSDNDSMGCVSGFGSVSNRVIALKTGVDNLRAAL